jgi:hypothetical protein
VKARTQFWIGAVLVLLVARAAHVHVLWADEDYHLAAAAQVLQGKVLYRDLWYDKPPLNALVLALIGGWYGWPLRLLSVALELAGAVVAFRFASKLGSERSGYIAAAGVVFFHIFYFASTAIPLEPDTFMILPHLLAVYWAYCGRPVWAGAMAGVAFLFNTKGLFVLASCVILSPGVLLQYGLQTYPVQTCQVRQVRLTSLTYLTLGFGLAVVPMGVWLIATGAFPGYVDQVWRWGALYAANPPVEPWWTPLSRLGNWMAFHAALWMGAVLALPRRWTLWAWLAISLIAAMIGWRLPPHYLHQAFPPLLMLASLGLATLPTRTRLVQALVAIALVVPIVRFTPRYLQLLRNDFTWRDLSMDRESRAVADAMRQQARAGDTIFVWGYRPNVVAYTRLPVSGRMWESQPVTTVPADRHLGDSTALDIEWAARNQAELVRTQPTFIVDGLSAYNRGLDLAQYEPLRAWFTNYCSAGIEIRGMVVYRRCK